VRGVCSERGLVAGCQSVSNGLTATNQGLDALNAVLAVPSTPRPLRAGSGGPTVVVPPEVKQKVANGITASPSQEMNRVIASAGPPLKK
jgi:hypothetical protein